MSTPSVLAIAPTVNATLLPLPAHFPVTWERPADAQRFWLRQRMHFPEPMTPLDEWLLQGEFEGAQRAAQHYGLPLICQGRCFNTYAYAHITPLVLSPEEAATQAARAQAALGAAMARLGEQWETEFLPEIQQILAEWAAFDLAGATLAQLVEHLTGVIRQRERLWDIHFLVWFPAYTAISLFEELHRDLFVEEEGATAADVPNFDAYWLLQGFGNKTLETTHALWRLSRRALAQPLVCQILQSQPPTAVLAALETSAVGRAFLRELRTYLEEYGQRSDKWVFSVPSWIEDPTPVIKNLQDYITQPDRDLMVETAQLAAARERRLTQLRRQLQDYPQPVVAHFEFLLKAAQEGCVLTEDHGFWIDYRGWYPIRRLFLELGHRFTAAAILEKPTDLFYLTLDEIQTTAAMLVRGLTPGYRHLLVVGRQAETEYYRGLLPPDALGTLPAGPAPSDPVTQTIYKFFGTPPAAQTVPNLLRGTGGSPGVARGPARVIRTLAESTKLQPGDILVAETTAPPWTPLFATVAAVVTDTGGILSHCASVAREYAIPAVVGVGVATERIIDGQLLEVNGATGVVRLLTLS
ncbi:MAG: hypothetical protein KF832_26795 [Caldilineaceae bacterium]|nr:hypothetical protein [Caldilineaceae bacterium]